MRKNVKGIICKIVLLMMVTSDCFALVLNNPYPANQSKQKIYYSSFSESPKTLDPAKSYASNEYLFIAQIYEPVLQYDYFKRPYDLVPLSARQMPQIQYFDKNRNIITDQALTEAAYTAYTIKIKSGIFYQPHPAFAKNSLGKYYYHQLPRDFLDNEDISELADFKYISTRELVADDYIYQIKRLANPQLNSPIFGLMSEYILGFKEYGKSLPKAKSTFSYLDLRKYPLEGVRSVDKYTFQIWIKGYYPQFIFWLAMPFFAPIPWEAERFYLQTGMDDKNLDLSWYPVGTGPFMLSENNPNSRMVLTKNPNFHEEYFPSNGSAEDFAKGYLVHRNERLPLIDKAIYTLEKESIPRWNKFLQGYYDLSGISNDSFDQAIHINAMGNPTLSKTMQNKGMQLMQSVEASIAYLGFNMMDNVVGGKSEKARKLRQAISIAVNYDEYIAIFYNGRGKPAQGPIPPGVMGYLDGPNGVNQYVYYWDGNGPRRLSLETAKKLLVEAGYPNGQDPMTGSPLILNYDVASTGSPDDKAQLDWMRKQFALIGIDLNIRATQYNRFQEKIRTGNAQIFSFAWAADYPDPENFLFLLYSGNGKVIYGGENATNYSNPQFDKLFNIMKNMPNGAQRQAIVNQMIDLVRRDAPWAWGINSISLTLFQKWVSPVKTSTVAQNTLKYMAIDVTERDILRQRWNQPLFWPLGLFFGILIALLIPFIFAYYIKQHSQVVRAKL